MNILVWYHRVRTKPRYCSVSTVEDGTEGLGLFDPLVLGPPVLEPDLDLSVGQAKVVSKRAPLLDGQVLGPLELGLKCPQLSVSERGARLPVCLVLFQVASEGLQRLLG